MGSESKLVSELTPAAFARSDSADRISGTSAVEDASSAEADTKNEDSADSMMNNRRKELKTRD